MVFRGIVAFEPKLDFLNTLSIQLNKVSNSLFEEITQKIKDNDPSISKEELLKNPNINLFYDLMNKLIERGYSHNPSFERRIGKGFLLLFDQLNSVHVYKKSCYVSDFMTLSDISNCNNLGLVKGSCSWPA